MLLTLVYRKLAFKQLGPVGCLICIGFSSIKSCTNCRTLQGEPPTISTQLLTRHTSQENNAVMMIFPALFWTLTADE